MNGHYTENPYKNNMKVSGDLVRKSRKFHRLEYSPKAIINFMEDKFRKMDEINKSKSFDDEIRGKILDVFNQKQPTVDKGHYVFDESKLSELCESCGVEYYHELREDVYEFYYKDGIDTNGLNYILKQIWK